MIDPLYYDFYRGFLLQRSLRVVNPAVTPAEPITLADAYAHLRLDLYGSPGSHPDDAILEQVYIPTARAICEMMSGRSFIVQEFEVAYLDFPHRYIAFDRNGMQLGIGPVRGITSVIYKDSTGADLTLDPSVYIVDPWTEPGWVYGAYGTSWPSALPSANSVRVRFTAGYDLSGASPYEFPLPPHYRWAMLLALGHIYENREQTTPVNLNELPLGLQAMLKPASLVNGFA